MAARLYAEDPAKGLLPSIGRLDLLPFGQSTGGRIDTGVYRGGEVSSFYDPNDREDHRPWGIARTGAPPPANEAQVQVEAVLARIERSA